jgi:membrane fusion protein, heavy metal efflux system
MTTMNHGEDDHDDHVHDEHKDDDHDDAVKLTGAELTEFNITTGKAGAGTLNVQTSLPGEVRLNADRLAHVVPRLPGIVREVTVTLGDERPKGRTAWRCWKAGNS